MMRVQLRYLTVAVLALVPLAAQAVPRATPATFSSAQIPQIKAQPSSVLAKFPEGGPAMANYVANAVMADPTLAEPMMSAAEEASPAQAAAMGAGVMRAANALAQSNPQLAGTLAQQVAKANVMRLRLSAQAMGINRYTSPSVNRIARANAMRERLAPLNHGVPLTPHPLVNQSRVTAQPDSRDFRKTVGTDLREADPLTTIYGTVVAVAANDIITSLVTEGAAASGAVSTSPTR